MSRPAPGETRTYEGGEPRQVDGTARRVSSDNIKFEGPSGLARAIDRPFKPVPEKERLLELRGTDPRAFNQLVAGTGRIDLALYEQHKSEHEQRQNQGDDDAA